MAPDDAVVSPQNETQNTNEAIAKDQLLDKESIKEENDSENINSAQQKKKKKKKKKKGS